MTQSRTARRGLCMLGFILLAGCGGLLTGPDGGLSVLTVLDGRTDSPVAVLSGGDFKAGRAFALTFPGFLKLQTTYRGTPILLWPDDEALPLSATRALVYVNHDPGVLVRWPDSVTRLRLVLDATLQSTPWARSLVGIAADVVSRAHPAMDVAIGGAGTPIQVRYDPRDRHFVTYPYAAMAVDIRYSDSGIVSNASIIVRSLDVDGFWFGEKNFQVAMAHELIHATGLLGHLPTSVKGTMSATHESYDFPEPTAAEILIMKMHYARLAGTILVGDEEIEGGQSLHGSSLNEDWHLVCIR